MDIAKILGMVEGKIYQFGETKYRIVNQILERKVDTEWVYSKLMVNALDDFDCFEEIPEPPKEYTLEELAGMSQEKLNGKRLVSVITGKICTARHQPGTTDLWLDARLTGKGLYAKEILGKWTIVEGE